MNLRHASPFSSVRLACGDDAHYRAPSRIDDDKKTSRNAAVQSKTLLAAVPSIVWLDSPVRIKERWQNIGKTEATVAHAPVILRIIPLEPDMGTVRQAPVLSSDDFSFASRHLPNIILFASNIISVYRGPRKMRGSNRTARDTAACRTICSGQWPYAGRDRAVGILFDRSAQRDAQRMVDFEHLNSKTTRLTVGAVNVCTGEMRYFDTRDMALGPKPTMASGALPTGFPAVRVEGEPYWDGGPYSSTLVEVVLDDKPRRSSLIFSVNMW